ncbi:MAG: methyltransferase domain-containing protein [Clostridia bacterium]|nr:methyltransferase domain-containing protein [Clostridia bacterium]
MEYLNDKGLLIEQPDNLYKLSSDAVALGNFVQCRKSDVVFDIGCGTGVLTLLIAFNHQPQKMVSIDINADAVKQLEKNLAINQEQLSATNFTVLHGDARQLHKLLNNQTADVIVCNPPYFNTGKKPLNEHKNLARHDDTLSLNDLATLCTKNVKYGGIVYFCYPASQIAKAITIFENNNFRIKEIKFLTNQKGVYLAIFRAKKGGGHHTTILA